MVRVLTNKLLALEKPTSQNKSTLEILFFDQIN